MGILKRLFGPKEPPAPPRDVMALVAPLARPALRLVRSQGDSASYLGGTPPALPSGAGWPLKGGRPLTFLACLDLPSLQSALAVPWLPPSGRLLFYYDAENQPWGFDPKDRGSFAVMHVTGSATTPGPPPVEALNRRSVTFDVIDTYPSWDRPDVAALQLTDAEAAVLIDARLEPYGEAPHHQVWGLPDPIQGDQMEMECQLVSNGLYCGDSSGYMSPKAAPLREGAQHWRLLLQIDTDEDLGVIWGDSGILYFWIREEDARAGRFDQAWAVLQCY